MLMLTDCKEAVLYPTCWAELPGYDKGEKGQGIPEQSATKDGSWSRYSACCGTGHRASTTVLFGGGV